MAAFREAAVQPDYPDAMDNLGGNLQSLGQLDEAIAMHRRAIALRPDFAQAYCNLGVGLQTQGKLDEAEAVLRPLRQFNCNPKPQPMPLQPAQQCTGNTAI